MRFGEKLAYIALGGTLMLVGMVAGGLFSPLGAQNKSDAIFDKITCEELEVVSVIGSVNISNAMVDVKSSLPRDLLRGTEIEGTSGRTLIAGGSISISGDDDGDSHVDIRTDERGGLIGVRGDSEALVEINTTDYGGRVAAFGNRQSSTAMAVLEEGGFVVVTDNGGDMKAILGVDEHGNGLANTWDKNGYIIPK